MHTSLARWGGSYDFASWLITARGNVVALQKQVSSNIIHSETTRGICAMSMNFQNFIDYNVGSALIYLLSPYPTGYSAYYIQNART